MYCTKAGRPPNVHISHVPKRTQVIYSPRHSEASIEKWYESKRRVSKNGLGDRRCGMPRGTGKQAGSEKDSKVGWGLGDVGGLLAINRRGTQGSIIGSWLVRLLADKRPLLSPEINRVQSSTVDLPAERFCLRSKISERCLQ